MKSTFPPKSYQHTHVHMYLPLLRGLCLWQGRAIHCFGLSSKFSVNLISVEWYGKNFLKWGLSVALSHKPGHDFWNMRLFWVIFFSWLIRWGQIQYTGWQNGNSCMTSVSQCPALQNILIFELSWKKKYSLQFFITVVNLLIRNIIECHLHSLLLLKNVKAKQKQESETEYNLKLSYQSRCFNGFFYFPRVIAKKPRVIISPL